MTRGALIFAFNNSEVDYVSLAAYSAKRIKTFLNIPVSIITNSEDVNDRFPDLFDRVINFTDNSRHTKRFYTGSTDYKMATWFNESRSNAFELTPYDETLVIDSDYIINSDFLKMCWDQNEDFLIYDKCMDLASWRNTREFEVISDRGIKFYWATVLFFRKTKKVEELFLLVDYIKKNWNYYNRLYQLQGTKFRNDYAFSIAISILNGNSLYSNFSVFPNKMIFITDKDFCLEHSGSKMKFLIQKSKSNEYTVSSIDQLDIHVMSKFSLMDVIKQ